MEMEPTWAMHASKIPASYFEEYRHSCASFCILCHVKQFVTELSCVPVIAPCVGSFPRPVIEKLFAENVGKVIG